MHREKRYDFLFGWQKHHIVFLISRLRMIMPSHRRNQKVRDCLTEEEVISHRVGTATVFSTFFSSIILIFSLFSSSFRQKVRRRWKAQNPESVENTGVSGFTRILKIVDGLFAWISGFFGAFSESECRKTLKFQWKSSTDFLMEEMEIRLCIYKIWKILWRFIF